jgi:hypothetical protein
MSDQDQTIACKDCRTDFVFSAGEAAFYADKGFQTPRRCKECRAKKKAADQGQQSYAAAEAPVEPQQPSNNRRKGGRRDHDDRY